MARKSAALDTIGEEISADLMKQASGGTSLQPAGMPLLIKKWEPGLVEAVPDLAVTGPAMPPVVDLQETLKVEFEPRTQEASAGAAAAFEHNAEDIVDTSEADFSSTAADGTVDMTKTVDNGILETANTVTDGAVSAAKFGSGLHVFDIPMNAALDVAGGAAGVATSVADVAKDVGGMVAGGVADAASKVADTVADKAKEMGGKIASGAADVANTVADTLTETAKDVGGKIAEGAQDVADKAADAAMDAAKTAGIAALDTAKELGKVFETVYRAFFRGW